jgi:arylsulfatase A-like enzyme
MQSNIVNRRDFLKTLGVSPILLLDTSRILTSKNNIFSGTLNDLPNILVLVFDALSSKNMSLYGYPRHTTPNIERFAQNATVFHRHYASGNFTTPGVASLLTGAYPWSHRAFNLRGTTNKIYSYSNLFTSLNRQYHTFAYTHNPLAYILFHQFQEDIHKLTNISELCLAYMSATDSVFNRDYPVAMEGEILSFRNFSYPSGSLFFSYLNYFERFSRRFLINKKYHDLFPRGIPASLLDAPPSFSFFLLEDAIDWLQIQLNESPKPFFGYIHLLPPHYPYNTRKDFINQFNDNWEPPSKPEHHFSMGRSKDFLNLERRDRRLYDETIAYADSEFGRLYEYMQLQGILDNTIVIFTSDHGEMFERGIIGHNTPTLYEPVINVPLIMSIPGHYGRRDIHGPTNDIDLFSTLLHIANMPIPPGNEGHLLPIFERDEMNTERSAFSIVARENSKDKPLEKFTVALMKNQFKLIHYAGYEDLPSDFELYDLKNDPEELNNLYDESTPKSIFLKEELLNKISEVNTHFVKRKGK